MVPTSWPLLMLLTNGPQDMSEFMRLLPCGLYDVKYLAQTCTSLTGGLKALADKLEQIGRDSRQEATAC
ncbi:hypothetical protein HPB48_008341 [Haemaphysalis longicornis]|uniref:Uncharacterized protein n=1 Tax=Haemaphysalis longicornis TaxID=44386 RepID=A0A9J6FTV4_HAELO|nr:hypothetical protein HPB48_008341 [Haemaphysalis longicornis]